MANRNSSGFTHAIHTLFEVGTLGGLSEGQLLEQFVARKTEAAFAALVARHGPMVLGVCESLLGDAHDAEDAFQAVFLILAKKARSIRDPDLLGNWLYGVARRTAQKAKARRARRRVRAGREEAMSSVAVANGLAEIESVRREETAMLHEEVDRLPESLRAPIVLCYLEGLTHGEAARRLRWPIGTVRSRMARARGLLRARLTRRGLACAAIVAAIESPRAVRAEVPHALAHTTVRSAIELATGTVSGSASTPVATLMEEVLKAMFMTQLKRIVAAALAVAAIATGAGIIAVGALQPQPPSAHGGAQAAQAADRQAVEGNRAGPTPQTRELLALQERIRSVARTTLPAIVSFTGATGVIITREGLILTQAHVTHPENARPGSKIKVILHDGTAAEAELLGADRVFDLSLVWLVKPGPYPFIPLADRNLAPGDGVLKLGYPAPLWYQKGRPPEVRFGRVLGTSAHLFRVDCRINGGDSGGPFVDLDGRLVGILNMSTPVLDEPSQKALFPHNLVMPRGNMWWTGTLSTMIRTRLARMEKGEIIEATNAELARLPAAQPIGTVKLIAEDRRTQGNDALGRFRNAVSNVRGSVVEILDEDEPVALGTVVDAAGLIITKASEVPDRAFCRLPGGRVTGTQVVGVDPAYDLALLRVVQLPPAGLVPVTWAKTADPPAGTLLAAAATGELPVAVGVVSIPRRDTPGPHPSAPARYQRNQPAGAPALTGSTLPGMGYRVETSEGSAATAGIRPGDVILTIAGSPVPDNSEIRRAVGKDRYNEAYFTFRTILEGRRAGERVPVRLRRGAQEIELSLVLKKVPDPEFGSEFVSDHRDAPPTVITADIPVLPHECGARAVGVNGTPIGLVISRFGVTGSFIIPGDRVSARLADLRAGKPLSGFPTPSAQPAATAPSAH